MDIYDLLAHIDGADFAGPSRVCLEQTLAARGDYEMFCVQLNLWLRISKACRDEQGRAAARICLGVTYAGSQRHSDAAEMFEMATSTFLASVTDAAQINGALCHILLALLKHPDDSAVGLLDRATRDLDLACLRISRTGDTRRWTRVDKLRRCAVQLRDQVLPHVYVVGQEKTCY